MWKNFLMAMAIVCFEVSCIPVTVNLYFKFEKEAESALDEFEEDIRGDSESNKDKEKTPPPKKSQSEIPQNDDSIIGNRGIACSLCFGGDEEKEEDTEKSIKIDKNNKTIRKIIENRKKRMKDLTPFYNDGFVGEGANAKLEIRDIDKLDDEKKEKLSKLVDEENKDRETFIKEVVEDNKLDEGKSKIVKKMYAKVLRKHAKVGWWIQDDPDDKNKEGKWHKKTEDEDEKDKDKSSKNKEREK